MLSSRSSLGSGASSAPVIKELRSRFDTGALRQGKLLPSKPPLVVQPGIGTGSRSNKITKIFGDNAKVDPNDRMIKQESAMVSKVHSLKKLTKEEKSVVSAPILAAPVCLSLEPIHLHIICLSLAAPLTRDSLCCRPNALLRPRWRNRGSS